MSDSKGDKPARFATLTPETMNAEQKAAVEAVLVKRPGLIGPFNAWLRSPPLTRLMVNLSDYLRYNSAMPQRLNEMAILMTARHWNASFEWFAHYRMAAEAGLKTSIGDDIARGVRPAEMDAEESAVYDLFTELRRDTRASEPTFRRAVELLGEQVVVELIAVSGYYDIVSMTLNTAEVPIPDGVDDPMSRPPAGR